MKPFLLIAGYRYYPSNGTGDWRATFNTYQEAQAAMTTIKETRDTKHISKEWLKTHEVPTDTFYEYNGTRYDWYEIVDLRMWTNNDIT